MRILMTGGAEFIGATWSVTSRSGTRRSVIDIVKSLERIVGPINREFVPRRSGDVGHSQADGLAATVDWMKSAQH